MSLADSFLADLMDSDDEAVDVQVSSHTADSHRKVFGSHATCLSL